MIDQRLTADEPVISFAPFRLLMKQQRLFRGNEPVPLGSRAFEVLRVLIENAGNIVGKHELIARVWPNLVVEECNLRTQILALRKALSTGPASASFISTVPRRGYRFTMPLSLANSEPETDIPARPRTLPLPLITLIGRSAEHHQLAKRLNTHRLVTIVGPAGVGKSALALAGANSHSDAYPDGCFRIDLVDSDAPDIACMIAATLGVEAGQYEPASRLGQRLSGHRVLLLIDNLDHRHSQASRTIAEIQQWAAHVHVLVTSREPLYLNNESVLRIAPLQVPVPGSVHTVTDAMKWPAIQYFTERAQASCGFAVTTRNLPDVIALCHLLDGLPLALQMVAAKTVAFDIRTLIDQLRTNNNFLVLSVPGSDQTPGSLASTYEHQLSTLDSAQLNLLQQLSLIDGAFTLERLRAINTGDAFDGMTMEQLFAGLVSQSLVIVEPHAEGISYRILFTLRCSLVQQANRGVRCPGSPTHECGYVLQTTAIATLNRTFQQIRPVPSGWKSHERVSHIIAGQRIIAPH
jgi:DNA-binding winged helix-turn-helix (wHTH) protein/predicted ATPase